MADLTDIRKTVRERYGQAATKPRQVVRAAWRLVPSS